MDKEYIPPTQFAGHTYSRLRNSTANHNVENAAHARTVKNKVASSVSKSGKINYFLIRDNPDGATEPKKMKFDSEGEDPFSFKSVDKRKSSSLVKEDLTDQDHDPHQMTKLPASRIIVKGEGSDEYLKVEKEEACFSSAFHINSRTASKKSVITERFLEAGKQMQSGQTVFLSEARLEASTNSQKRGVQFKRHPLKTNSRVVTLVDKPDSPLQKSGSKRKGWQRGRKPLTVYDPESNEQYNRHYVAQQLKEKPDAAAKGINKSTVVFKKEIANKAQGPTVVCKPKSEAKYISRNSKPKGILVPVASDTACSQVTSGKNVNAESITPASANTEAVFKRRSARLQIISALAANSERTTPYSDGNAITLLSVNPSSTKHATRGRHSSIALADSATSSSSAIASLEGTPADDVSSGRGVKHPQNFKSQAPQMCTTVPNIKQTHEVHKLGETQDIMAKVDCLLDSLQDSNSIPIRCLSCWKLASKCISPAFRKKLCVHGRVTKIFSLLHDASSDPYLALFTSAMMFLLSRDSLNMELDQDSLNLMLRLSEVDADERGCLDASALKKLEKIKQKIMELLTKLPQETPAREIDLGFVSTGNLAMESLLSLTLKYAGERFKERSPWGLDHILDFVTNYEHSLPEDVSQDIQKTLPLLRKLNRCLEVLRNITSVNSDNQIYLISYKNAALVQACTRILRRCQTCMPSYKMLETVEENKVLKDLPGYTISTCMLTVLRVLDNVTFKNELVNLDLEMETALMQTVVQCLTTMHWYVPTEKRFDLDLLCLSLLRSLVKHKKSNCQIMMSMQTVVKDTEKSQPKTMSAIKAVVELFVQREEAARQMEEDTSEDNDDESYTEALDKATRDMKYSYVASYAGLLLGFTIIDNKEYAAAVKKLMPNENFDLVVRMLKIFLNFSRVLAVLGLTDSSTDFSTAVNVTKFLEMA